MTPPETENARLARMCLAALGSLHCELPRREKLVLKAIVDKSYVLDRDVAFFASNQQFIPITRLHETDVASALSSLRRNRLISREPGVPLRHFRQTWRYRVDPDALLRVASDPAVSGSNPIVARACAEMSTWLVRVNREYPPQFELIPPDPHLLNLAMDQISRASALAADRTRNEEPKPIVREDGGEAYPSERAARPEAASAPVQDPATGQWVYPADMRRMLEEALARPNGGEAPVGKSQTGRPSGLRISNHSCAGDQIPDGDNLSPSEYPDQGIKGGPVGKSQTGDGPGFAVEASLLLAKYGDEWKPPTAAQAVFDELLECMGPALGNYGSQWWGWCQDRLTRRDVVEAIATWKLARHHPKHRPWRGGRWRDEFFTRQRVRLAAAVAATEGAGR